MERETLPLFHKGSSISSNNIITQNSTRKNLNTKQIPHLRLKFINNDEDNSKFPPILKQFQERSRKIQTVTSNYKKLTKNLSTKVN